MIGAIAGDIIGSVHEYTATKSADFELFVPGSTFTDDTVLAVAVADCLLNGLDYAEAFQTYVAEYPDAGYGFRFSCWAKERRREPYNSYGNGSAMRVPAIGHAFDSLDAALAEAARSARVTHNHPEGIKGARAIVAAIFMAKQGDSRTQIKGWLQRAYGYDLNARLDDMRPEYRFDESCQKTVPAALIAFFESDDYEDAVRKAISLGGDADTLACISGAVAEAHYGKVPAHILSQALAALDERLRGTVIRFCLRYGVPLGSSADNPAAES